MNACIRSEKWLAKRVGVAMLFLGLLNLFAAPSSQAQLNENCTVSVLNRTTQVRPDGTWTIPNVPASFGQVRARATCVDNGVTRSGQSDFFTIPIDGQIEVEGLTLDQADPIPAALHLSAPVTTLTTAGQTAPLTVMAAFAGGDSADVTALAGTNYRISNPAVATVGPQGRVTAVSGDTVLVSAVRDGAMGILQLQVVLDNDSDGDGITDDLEVANGLDPTNPFDSFADSDGDGLSAQQELVTFGTDPHNSDSDGDGIPDGEEVVMGEDSVRTNPLLADSDGDGVRDGLEIDTGSDPNDASSLNLSEALTAVEVTPEVIILTVNAIVGEASEQLRVLGRLRDNTTIDLTSTARGTTYASSDLTICNFGAPDGRIFAGADGLCSVTIAQSGFRDEVPVLIRSFSPRTLSALNVPGAANHVAVHGDVAYIAAGEAGIALVDVSDRSHPLFLNAIDTSGQARRIDIHHDILTVADGEAGLRLFDLTAPQAPVFIAALDMPGTAHGVVMTDQLALVAGGDSGLHIIDIKAPNTLQRLATVDIQGDHIQGVGIHSNQTLAAMAGASDLYLFSLSDPIESMVLSTTSLGTPRTVVIRETTAVVANRGFNLTTFDLSDPANPTTLASLPEGTSGSFDDVAVMGPFAFGADGVFANSIPLIDISQPDRLVIQWRLNFEEVDGEQGRGITVDTTYVYLVAHNPESGASSLHIGQYAPVLDENTFDSDLDGLSDLEEMTLGRDGFVTHPLLADTDGDGVRDALEIDTGSDPTDTGSLNLARVLRGLRIEPPTFLLSKNDDNPEPMQQLAVIGELTDDRQIDLTAASRGTIYTSSDMTVCQFGTANGLILAGQDGACAIVARNGPFSAEAEGTVVSALPKPAYPAQTFRVGERPETVTLADMNGDGALDILTVNRFSDDLSLLFGTSDGAFAGEVRLPAGKRPETLVVYDINTDGHLDIITSNAAPEFVIYLGNGDGSFAALRTTPVSSSPHALAAADMNQDGHVDLVGLDGNTARVYPGDGAGSFAIGLSQDVGESPTGLAVADVNGDALPDLVITDSSDRAIWVLPSREDGGFDDPIRSPLSLVPWDFVLADVSGDTVPDVIVAALFQGQIMVLTNQGNGAFGNEQIFAAGTAPEDVSAVDLNRDGALDIVAIDRQSNDILILLGREDGAFEAPWRAPTGTLPLASTVGDVNRDGDVDVVTASDNNDVSVLIGQGDGTLAVAMRSTVGSGGEAVAAADVSGDGVRDLVTVKTDSDQVTILLGQGDGSFAVSSQVSVGSALTDVALADLNRDGMLDILSTGGAALGEVSVLLGSAGGIFTLTQRIEVNDLLEAMAVSEVNGDGVPDVVTANRGDGTLSLLLGQADGALSPATSLPGHVAPKTLVMADFTGDGLVDIVAAAQDVTGLILIAGRSNGSFELAAKLAQLPGLNPMAIGDLNADGKADLAGVTDGGRLLALLGQGDGSFLPVSSIAAEAKPQELVVIDVNHDGLPDVVTANADDVSVFMGNGDGSFAAEQRFAVGAYVGFKTISVGDVTGDQKPDIAVPDTLTGDIVLLPHQ